MTDAEYESDSPRNRVFSDADQDVWVVERNPGSGWRVSAVLTSYEDAKRYRDDLRQVLNEYPDEFPEEYKTEYDVKIRHGGRDSPTGLYESWPPEGGEAVAE